MIIFMLVVWAYGQFLEAETVKMFELVDSVLGECLLLCVSYGNSMHELCFTDILRDRYDLSRGNISVHPFLSVEETRDELLSSTDRLHTEPPPLTLRSKLWHPLCYFLKFFVLEQVMRHCG